MKRRIDKVLMEWKNRRLRKPLVVRGARQVGKTHSITSFGRQEFDSMMHLDFELDRRLRRIFDGDLTPANVLLQCEAYTGKTAVPGKTLLFLDEIQACPRALLSLRYFHEQMPALHVIAAGSLLEFALEDVAFPVGRVEFEWLRPLCFDEFLWAAGLDHLAAQIPGLDANQPVPDALHEKLLEQLRLYFLIGGMPEAVSTFVESHVLATVVPIHQTLCQSYFHDLSKYGARVDRECLEHIFEQIPARVGGQIKYTSLHPEKRIEKIKETLRVLERALLIHKVHATSAQGLPLGADASPNVFKAVFLDIGLMQHVCGLSARDILDERDLLDVYRGALAEQFVGQELLVHANGSENGRLYYWARPQKSSSAEVDYLLVRQGRIIPIEVKSGAWGRLKSLWIFLQEHPHCKAGIILSSAPTRADAAGVVKALPLYARLGDG
ncbi:MAG: ATP-binding protein [Verrucomicrobia bacterium]|nr:ATP-binding protein [Verrucomicrobiota bacterium]